jgi:hypothetical protein
MERILGARSPFPLVAVAAFSILSVAHVFFSGRGPHGAAPPFHAAVRGTTAPAAIPVVVVAGLNYRNMRPRLDTLYGTYAADLASLRSTMASWCAAGRDCLSDAVEVEMTYLRLRSARPAVVWEVSPHMGFTTVVILTALRDNGFGRLMSFDIVDKVSANVPPALAAGGRWTFFEGDFRATYALHAAERPDYLLLDSYHSHAFGEFYTTQFFPWLGGSHVFVSLHDVYNPSFWSDDRAGRDLAAYPEWMPNEEGLTVIDWLKDQPDACGVFTLATKRNAAQRAVFADVQAIRRRHLGESAVSGNKPGDNPTLFFELNCDVAL